MFYNKDDKLQIQYSNNLQAKTIKSSLWAVSSYICLIVIWQYTLSFQSSMFKIMNWAISLMLAFTVFALFVCAEERETIVKHAKKTLLYYLLVVFIWDMFFKLSVVNMLISNSLNTVDPSLQVTRQFTMVSSTLIKLGVPIGYIVWIIQKIGIFKAGITKRKAMERIRDVRPNAIKKNVNKEQEDYERI